MGFSIYNIVSKVSWLRGFMVSHVSWCHCFHGVIGFVVSRVSWFHRFRGVNGFIGFVASMVS